MARASRSSPSVGHAALSRRLPFASPVVDYSSGMGFTWPSLAALDCARLAACPVVLVGVGAIGRPLAEQLAYLGFRRFVLIDPKYYRERSVASQCEPHEIGRPKAAVVAERLMSLGAEAIPLTADVDDVEPGFVEPDAVIVVSADNRRAEIVANRLAGAMRVRLVKANVEPSLLIASVRSYDLRGEHPAVCLECHLTDAQYAAQRHPVSCDGSEDGRPTGSPRALCQVAAGGAALIVAQLAGLPAHWTRQWYGRQWQLSLLTGQATGSELPPNAECRWDHALHWPNLRRLPGGPAELSLATLFELASCPHPARAHLRFSSSVATQARCIRCQQVIDLVCWCRQLADPVGSCACGGQLMAIPYWTYTEMAAELLQLHWLQPLADWGVPSRAIIAIESSAGPTSAFVVGTGATRK